MRSKCRRFRGRSTPSFGRRNRQSDRHPARLAYLQRDLTRTRKQLVREISQHTLRIQRVLEDANLKLTSVISDVMGMSGRAMIEGIIRGDRISIGLIAAACRAGILASESAAQPSGTSSG